MRSTQGKIKKGKHIMVSRCTYKLDHLYEEEED